MKFFRGMFEKWEVVATALLPVVVTRRGSSFESENVVSVFLYEKPISNKRKFEVVGPYLEAQWVEETLSAYLQEWIVFGGEPPKKFISKPS